MKKNEYFCNKISIRNKRKNIMKFYYETKTDANKIDIGNGKDTE